MWFDHLRAVVKNRQRGARKAAETSHQHRQQSGHAKQVSVISETTATVRPDEKQGEDQTGENKTDQEQSKREHKRVMIVSVVLVVRTILTHLTMTVTFELDVIYVKDGIVPLVRDSWKSQPDTFAPRVWLHELYILL